MKRFVPVLFFLPALLSVPVCSEPEQAAPSVPEQQLLMLNCSNGVYSLWEAAAVGNAAVLGARLAEGADPNEVDEQGNSPLHLAARGKSARVLQLLLAAGADPHARDAAGRTAAELCSLAPLRALLAESATGPRPVMRPLVWQRPATPPPFDKLNKTAFAERLSIASCCVGARPQVRKSQRTAAAPHPALCPLLSWRSPFPRV